MVRRLLVLLTIMTASTSAQADSYFLDVAQFAQSICGDIPQGSLNRTSIRNKVQANAGTLAQVVSGNAATSTSEVEVYKGIPFDKLPDKIPTTSMCKFELVKLLLNNPSVPDRRVSERDAIQHLMDSICDRGVLQNDYSWELPGRVYVSVERMRTELKNTLDQLATDSAAREPLQSMQRASRMMLQDPTLFPRGPADYARPVTDSLAQAIHKFRVIFAENTSQIVQTYALKGNCDLSAGLNAEPSSPGVAEPKK
jgi:hypothetical protein